MKKTFYWIISTEDIPKEWIIKNELLYITNYNMNVKMESIPQHIVFKHLYTQPRKFKTVKEANEMIKIIDYTTTKFYHLKVVKVCQYDIGAYNVWFNA